MNLPAALLIGGGGGLAAGLGLILPLLILSPPQPDATTSMPAGPTRSDALTCLLNDQLRKMNADPIWIMQEPFPCRLSPSP